MQWTRFTEADSLDSMLAFTDHTLIMARLNTVAWVLFLAMACAVPTARHNRLEAEVKALEVGVKAGKPVMTAIDENKHVSNKRGAKNGTVAAKVRAPSSIRKRENHSARVACRPASRGMR